MATEQADRVSFDYDLRVIGMARVAVEHVIGELKLPGRQGGYFCRVMREGNPTALPALILGIGTVPVERGAKYLAFAQEKAHRLAKYPEHQSSWQSRNEEENKYGGAIAAGPYYLSFSGLPEVADETAMLLTAVGLGLLTKEEALAIADHSDNAFFIEMLRTLNWDKAIVVGD